ncbi:MAG: HlyC/CorC family transporter [Planctomycetota bacterium]|nr:MAG: HlyC/CorC family transporter [Planctomycetota bacterium]
MTELAVLCFILMGALLLVSGFFSGSETALFSLTPHQKRTLDQSGGFLGVNVRSLLSDQHALLVTLLLGNMVVNIFYASLSLIAAAQVAHATGSRSSFVAVELGALLALILIGEVTPKNLAISSPVFFAKWCSPIMLGFFRVLGPVRVFFEYVTRFFVALLTRGKRDEELGPRDIEALAEAGQAAGILGEKSGLMLAEVPALRSIRVREIMIPRTDVVFFDVLDGREALKELFRSSNHTRLPVCERSRDNLLGFIDGKDTFIHRDRDIRELIQPPFFMPEGAAVEQLLREFRRHRRAMAVVVDEYGGVIGLVTIEDALETIVGEIEDEHDRVGRMFLKLDDGSYLVSGAMNLREFLERFELERTDEKGDTVAGCVIALHGDVPSIGTEVKDRHFTFIVRRMAANRVRVVEVRPHPGAELDRPETEDES